MYGGPCRDFYMYSTGCKIKAVISRILRAMPYFWYTRSNTSALSCKENMRWRVLYNTFHVHCCITNTNVYVPCTVKCNIPVSFTLKNICTEYILMPLLHECASGHSSLVSHWGPLDYILCLYISPWDDYVKLLHSSLCRCVGHGQGRPEGLLWVHRSEAMWIKGP